MRLHFNCISSLDGWKGMMNMTDDAKDVSFARNDTTPPRAWIDYSETDFAGEFYCTCGHQSSWGGFGCVYMKCPKCDAIFHMPQYLLVRPVTETEYGIKPRPFNLDDEHNDDPDEVDFHSHLGPRED